MRRLPHFAVYFAIAAFIFPAAASGAPPSRAETLAAMKKAATFMVKNVSCHGGYLWTYRDDLSEQWGEAPARKSQIWVQGGTPKMGRCFLDLYRTTGDAFYLECAKKAANALVYGQHPLGGWHYFIDFDKTGLDQWYRDVFSNFKWGMEEYRHYYGNCTFDDDSTVGPTRFLLDLYMTTLDPAYRVPLDKALDFILMSQYPNGAWPQRYPLRHDFVHDGLPDYTSLYTFNDGVITGNIDILIEAWEKLGDERYLEAAKRGMGFIVISQGPPDQAAWADQHGMDLLPAWGRTHEPAGFMTRYTLANIAALQRYYLVTGDRRYIDPIPAALDWFERSKLETLTDGRLRLARRYEVGTNLPLYHLRTDEVNEEGHGLWRLSNEPDESTAFYTIDIVRLRRDYERISALSPEEAVAQYQASKMSIPSSQTTDPADVERIISELDSRGAWVEDVRVYGMDVTKPSPPGVKFDNYNRSVDDDHASIHIQGISTSLFVQRIRTLAAYAEQTK